MTPEQVTVQRARALRANQTSAEGRLWGELRGRKLGGWKWRRQAPIGRYIVDFYCPAARLIVELDGSHHLDQQGYDARRTTFLEAQGLTVIRYPQRGRLGRGIAPHVSLHRAGLRSDAAVTRPSLTLSPQRGERSSEGVSLRPGEGLSPRRRCPPPAASTLPLRAKVPSPVRPLRDRPTSPHFVGRGLAKNAFSGRRRPRSRPGPLRPGAAAGWR